MSVTLIKGPYANIPHAEIAKKLIPGFEVAARDGA
jgi:hypothetical protein